jgi:FkbM family methyltransferase
MPGAISKFFNLISNIRNWYLYTFNKEKRHSKSLEFITKPNSLKLLVDADNYAVFKEIFVEDFYKIDAIVKNLDAQPLIIDIGANRGLFCAMMLSKKPGSKIIAYEPLPENTVQLEKFKVLNADKTKNLQVYQQAVSGTPEKTIKIYTGGADSGAIASIYRDFDSRNSVEIEVAATTLTDILQNLEAPVDILKIDCEGAEYPILYNTSKETLQRVTTMLIEVHELDRDNRNVNSLENFLQSNGFSTTTEKFRNDCYLLTAKNTTV